MVLMPHTEGAPRATVKLGWLLVVLVVGALIATLVAVKSHHPTPKWPDLPDPRTTVGTTLGAGSGLGSGAVIVKPIQRKVVVHLWLTCSGEGTVGFAFGEASGSGRCFAGAVNQYEFDTPPTAVPPQLNIDAPPGVIWKLAAAA